jgi:peptidoglycan/xylan/chitin deacetylase (PgdA/CDA1 family)
MTSEFARIDRVILTFHGVGQPRRPLDEGEDPFWLDQRAFLDILDAIVGRDDFEITFDDGNQSDLEIALPALLERNLKATFFLLAGKLREPGMLDCDGVRELAAAGMRIGSHGMDHRPWRRLTDTGAMEEIFTAKDCLESILAAEVKVASCPFGRYDRMALRRARLAGFEAVFTSDGGRASSRQWLRPRNTVMRDARPASVMRMAREHRLTASSLVRRAKTAIKAQL